MSQLRVRVFRARGISVKHAGRQLWVVIEVGKDRFKTAMVPIESDCRVAWDEECAFELKGDPSKLFLSLAVQSREGSQSHTVGTAEIDGRRLVQEATHSAESHFERWTTLTKKGRAVPGELCYDVCLSAPDSSREWSGSDRSRRHARSIRDIKDMFRSSKSDLSLGLGGGSTSSTATAMPLTDAAAAAASGANGGTAPEVTSVTPAEGPASGGTVVVIRGRHLGTCRADVLSVVVAGVDCTPSLTFHSPSKLTCETAPGSGAGAVVVTTHSGGRASSSATFTFQAADKKDKERVDALQAKVAHLTAQLRERDDVIAKQNAYIDLLLVKVMERAPALLEEMSRELRDTRDGSARDAAQQQHADEEEERKHARAQKRRSTAFRWP